jgi:hypothetical protein
MGFTLSVSDTIPSIYYEYHKRAKLVEIFEGGDQQEESFFYLSVAKGSDWPFLIVAQKYAFSPQMGFHPGVVLIPETNLLFIGAGERLLAYKLEPPAKLWEEVAHGGFRGWERYQQVIIMSAELQLAAWDIQGKKLCSARVEPSWHYTIKEQTLQLNVTGKETSFSVRYSPGFPS